MARLIVLSGLPGSGKTTRARQLAAETGAHVVGRDELRAMLCRRVGEQVVTHLAAAVAGELLDLGQDVVVDGWNMAGSDETVWWTLARSRGADLTWLHLDTPVDLCVVRDASRPNGIGETAVRRAAAEHALFLERHRQEAA